MLTTKQKVLRRFWSQSFRLTSLKLGRSRFAFAAQTLYRFSMLRADRRRMSL
jgi:hypothetical protein